MLSDHDVDMVPGTVACEVWAARETLVSLPLGAPAAIPGARDNAKAFPGQDPQELSR